MNHSESTPPDFRLSPADAAALDALVSAGFDFSRVDPAQAERARRLLLILGVLDSNTGLHAEGLADRIMAKVNTAIVSNELVSDDLMLSPHDARALQALADAGYDIAEVPAELAKSAAKHNALASLVTAKPAGIDWSSDLAARTFDLVMLTDDAAPIPIGREIARTTLGKRFWDVVAVAATLLIGASVLVPIIGAVRSRQIQTACSGRMGDVASAMSAYAGANQNALPAATASFGGTWWNVGKDPKTSNSANLFTLAREGYAKLASLTCPGHELVMPNCATACEPSQTWDWPDIEHVSYSYQVMAGPSRPRWNDTVSVAILADRSPVILRALRKEEVRPFENSPNHNGRGQSVLFIDGAVRWMPTPVLAYAHLPAGAKAPQVMEDNIWLPWQLEEILRQAQQNGKVILTGQEVPASPFDTFLAP